MKLIRYMLLCNLILLISCNDADYKTLDNSPKLLLLQHFRSSLERLC